MLALINPQSEDGNGREAHQDGTGDNLPGNEKVELSVENIKIIIIICQTVIYIYIFTARLGHVLQNYRTHCFRTFQIMAFGSFFRKTCVHLPDACNIC